MGSCVLYHQELTLKNILSLCAATSCRVMETAVNNPQTDVTVTAVVLVGGCLAGTQWMNALITLFLCFSFQFTEIMQLIHSGEPCVEE